MASPIRSPVRVTVRIFHRCDPSFSDRRRSGASSRCRRIGGELGEISRRFVTMTALGKEQQLLDVEKRFWDAMKTKNADVAGQMTDDKCIVVGAQGVSAIDPETMSKLTT